MRSHIFEGTRNYFTAASSADASARFADEGTHTPELEGGRGVCCHWEYRVDDMGVSTYPTLAGFDCAWPIVLFLEALFH